MELNELNKIQDEVSASIAFERFSGSKIPNLEHKIAEYRQLVSNYAASLREKNQLTHNGKLIKTPNQFKRICEKEGMSWLLDNATPEVNPNA